MEGFRDLCIVRKCCNDAVNLTDFCRDHDRQDLNTYGEQPDNKEEEEAYTGGSR